MARDRQGRSNEKEFLEFMYLFSSLAISLVSPLTEQTECFDADAFTGKPKLFREIDTEFSREKGAWRDTERISDQPIQATTCRMVEN
jgi:hypothetical protein